jgi:hypothetical protein
LEAAVTTLLEREIAPPPGPPRQRRIWLRALIAVVVLALIGLGIGWLVYLNTYQPLVMGNGPYGSVTPHTLKTIGDGIDDTNSILVGPPGTKGTADYPVWNNGSHAVTLLGLDASQAALGEVLTWTPIQAPKGGFVGEPGDGRAFPATIQPGHEVIVQDTVTQPVCSQGYRTASIIDIPIRWSALGVHHVWELWLQASTSTVPITVCPPKAALAHGR